jgi:dolichol kinase
MDDCELVAFITALACGISKCFSEEEIEILGASFTQLGDTLATILVKRGQKNKTDDMKNAVNKFPRSQVNGAGNEDNIDAEE